MGAANHIHRQVRMAVAAPAQLANAITGLRAPGALVRAFAGARIDEAGRLTMVLAGPDDLRVTWTGDVGVSDVLGGADLRLVPSLDGAPTATLRVRSEEDGAQVVVDAEACVADGSMIPDAWRRTLEPLARLLAADLAAGPAITPHDSVRVRSATPASTAPSGAPTVDDDSTARGPLGVARQLLDQDPRRLVIAAAAAMTVAWLIGSRRRRA